MRHERRRYSNEVRRGYGRRAPSLLSQSASYKKGALTLHETRSEGADAGIQYGLQLDDCAQNATRLHSLKPAFVFDEFRAKECVW